jgi:hypothetical protein
MGGVLGLAEPLGVLSHSLTSVHRPLELRVGLQQHHRANSFRQTMTPYWDQITQPLPRAISFLPVRGLKKKNRTWLMRGSRLTQDS